MVPTDLLGAAQTLLTCVCDALNDDLRPVCKCYQTVGTPVIASCCECSDGGANGELSVHFRRLYDAEAASLDEVRRVRPCRGGATAAQFRLVLARCLPTVDSHGELPDPVELTESSDDQMRDAELIWQSLACCADLELRVDDITVDLGPSGGCSIIFADVTVAVRVPALPSTGSA